MLRREGLNEEEMRKLEQRNPSNDSLPGKLRIQTHYGSIEAAEEKRFPWLRYRRRRR